MLPLVGGHLHSIWEIVYDMASTRGKKIVSSGCEPSPKRRFIYQLLKFILVLPFEGKNASAEIPTNLSQIVAVNCFRGQLRSGVKSAARQAIPGGFLDDERDFKTHAAKDFNEGGAIVENSTCVYRGSKTIAHEKHFWPVDAFQRRPRRTCRRSIFQTSARPFMFYRKIQGCCSSRRGLSYC